jgi:hypothetical protein
MKQKLLLALFAGIIAVNVFAQPQIRGQRAIGGNSFDNFRSMYVTRDSGLIVGGYSFSNISGEKTQNSKGESDYWIVKTKLDSTYKIQWDKTIGGNFSDFLTGITPTRDGGYFIGGYSNSLKSGDKSENPRGDFDVDLYPDYWVVKLDSLRNIEWDKTIGGNIVDDLMALQQTTDGGFILGGYSNSDAGYEKTTPAHRENWNEPHNDYWIVKLNRKGSIQWDKTIGGTWRDWLTCLQQTKDGGYILGGYSESDKSFEKTENSRGSTDYWIVKVDNAGNIQWDKTLGGTDNDQLYAIEQTTDGGYILGGSSNSNISGEKTENSRGNNEADDYWIIKVDSRGNIEWNKTIGGDDFDELQSIQQTIDGGYIAAGYSNSGRSGDKTEANKGDSGLYGFYNDYWIVKLNKDGAIEWDKTIGGSIDDWCYSIREISRDHYIIGGTSESDISGDKKVRSRGEGDYWFIGLIYKKPGSFEISELKNANNVITSITNNKNFTVYPNPATDEVHVEIVGTAVISLTDRTGKMLLLKQINNSDVIDVSGLLPGLYYLQNNTTGVVQKIIVKR